MKTLLSVFISFVMFTLTAFPCAAAYTEQPKDTANQKVQTFYLENGISVTSTIVTYKTSTRASTRSGHKTNTYTSNGVVIAEVTLYATFSYSGASASVLSAYSDYTTYGGWSYGSESISKSGATAKLSARLSHTLNRPVTVSTSLSCSPTGVLY